MTHLKKLYQEVILDHNENPRNFGELEDADCEAQGDNPLCGDEYLVAARLDDEEGLDEVAFSGEGCAISKAAASMMTQHVADMTREETEELIDQFRAMLTGDLDLDEDDHDLGHLKVFESVAARPERIKCAVLPWHTLLAALEGKQEISTEGEADPKKEVE